MRITILNGNPDPNNTTFEGYLRQMGEGLGKRHQLKSLTLREMNIKYCVGCFGCWVKKPGECVAADASRDVCRAVINSDFTLLASPVRMGFVSSLLKKTMDKLIPLVHPYFDVVNFEAHHRARYAAYPLLGLLLEKSADTDDEDVAIIGDILSRTALNLKSRLALTRLMLEPVEEVAHAVNNL